MKTNKTAGFWFRLLSRLIDLFFVISFISLTAYFFITKTKGISHFIQDYYFYIWTLSSGLIMLIITVLIPIFTKGRSIGNFLTRTRVIANPKESLIRGLLNRELFFGLAWTIILVLFAIVLTPKIFIGIIVNNNTKISLTTIDQFRFGIINTVAGINVFIQFIFAISILVKKNGDSLIDVFSKTNVVRTRKFIEKPKHKKTIKIEPRLVNDKSVEWVKGE